jgi:hypothetical protein
VAKAITDIVFRKEGGPVSSSDMAATRALEATGSCSMTEKHVRQKGFRVQGA